MKKQEYEDFIFYEDMLSKFQRLNRESTSGYIQIKRDSRKRRTALHRGRFTEGFDSLIIKNTSGRKSQPITHSYNKTRKSNIINGYSLSPIKQIDLNTNKNFKKNDIGYTQGSTSQMQSNSEEKNTSSQFELKPMPFITQLYGDQSPKKKQDLMRAIKSKARRLSKYDPKQEQLDNEERMKIKTRLSNRIIEASNILASAIIGIRVIKMESRLSDPRLSKLKLKSKSKSNTKSYSLRKRGEGSSESFIYEESLLQKMKKVCCL